jgi:hypothetical protein
MSLRQQLLGSMLDPGGVSVPASCANMGLVRLRQADRLFVQLERDAVFPPNRLEQGLYHYRPPRRIIAIGLYTRVPINEQGNYLLCADAAQSRILKGPARHLFNFGI